MILEYRLADLSRPEVERVQTLERDLGVILVAYRKQTHEPDGRPAPTSPREARERR